jgi:hypothetical protein
MLAIFVVVFVRTEVGLYILLLSMLLSPEIILSGKGTIAEQREIVLRIDDLLILIIAFTWFAKTAVNKELGLFLRTPLNGAIAAYVVSHLVSTLWGVLGGQVKFLSGFFYVLKYVEYIFVYFMTVNILSNREQANRLVTTAFVTAAIVALIAIAQIPSGERVSAPFEGEVGEPNTLGGYLLFMMAIALGVALETTQPKMRMVMSLLFGLMFLPFLYTQSRASYLAFIPVCAMFLLLSRKRLIVVLSMIVAVVFGTVFLPAVVVDRVLYTFQPEPNQPTARVGRLAFDPSTSERLLNSQEALVAWTERPILGFGVTGHRFLDAQYPRTLVETGALGFLAFCWLLWSVARAAWGSYQRIRDPSFKGLALGFLVGYVGLLVHGIGANTFILVRIMEPFWFFAGIVTMLPLLQREGAGLGPSPQRGPMGRSAVKT